MGGRQVKKVIIILTNLFVKVAIKKRILQDNPQLGFNKVQYLHFNVVLLNNHKNMNHQKLDILQIDLQLRIIKKI